MKAYMQGISKGKTTEKRLPEPDQDFGQNSVRLVIGENEYTIREDEDGKLNIQASKGGRLVIEPRSSNMIQLGIESF